MKIFVNDITEDLPEEISIRSFLALKELENRRGIVIIHNGKVVKREDWDKVILREGDEIKIFSFVQGG